MAGPDVEGDGAAGEVLGTREVLCAGDVLANRSVAGAGVVFGADRLPVDVAPGGTVVASALPALIPDMRATAAARRKAMDVHRQRKVALRNVWLPGDCCSTEPDLA
jgi:tetrahydrodipicolinate N-succinyltransferase